MLSILRRQTRELLTLMSLLFESLPLRGKICHGYVTDGKPGDMNVILSLVELGGSQDHLPT